MNRTRVTRGLATGFLLIGGMTGLGGTTPFEAIPLALATSSVAFHAQVTYAVGSHPSAIATADFNGDQHPDLVVTNYDGGTLSVLLGKGDGTFAPPATYAVGTNPTAVAIGDFNGDGYPDLAVANKGDNTVSVLLSAYSPTAARVSAFGVSHAGKNLVFHWQRASRSGVVGFNLYAGTHRLNGQLIPVHACAAYRYTTRWTARPYALHTTLRDGRQIVTSIH